MTIQELLSAAASALGASGIEAPRREARLLLAAATNLAPATLIGWAERGVSDEAVARFEALLARRLWGEPFSRIVERREFWSMEFELGPDTLDPRPDSETLVTAALDHVANRHAVNSILDLGTGSGCLLLALLGELPHATGFGIDRSAAAITIARRNATRLGFAARAQFAVMDWATAFSFKAGLVVSNPPYIATPDIAALERGVRDFDPALALDGGLDGLHAYRRLLPEIPRLLAPGALAIFEIGAGQAEAVTKIAAESGLMTIDLAKDLAGYPRAVVCIAASSQK